MPIKKVDEEYELIPLSPIRRLEKRIERIESSPGADIKEIFHEIVDIVRMNQHLVDELAKTNDALRIELAKLPSRLEELIDNLNELLSYIKAAASEEAGVGPEAIKPLVEKMDQLIETNKKIIESNEIVTSLLEEVNKKLKPPLPPRKPLSLPPRMYPPR